MSPLSKYCPPRTRLRTVIRGNSVVVGRMGDFPIRTFAFNRKRTSNFSNWPDIKGNQIDQKFTDDFCPCVQTLLHNQVESRLLFVFVVVFSWMTTQEVVPEVTRTSTIGQYFFAQCTGSAS